MGRNNFSLFWKETPRTFFCKQEKNETQFVPIRPARKNKKEGEVREGGGATFQLEFQTYIFLIKTKRHQ
jgi:hypothetical protein